MASLPQPPSLASMRADHFEPVRGQVFEARAPAAAEPFALVLGAVRRRTGPPGFREPFSLEFLGPQTPAHGQGLYCLSHPRLGDFDVFVVPTGASEAGTSYEVSFG